jgi:hypothetical protein
MKGVVSKILFLILIIGFNKLLAQSDPSIRLGQMVKQTMKEAWADIEPLTHDDQGVYYLTIPYTDVIAGPVVGDNDYYLFMVNESADLAKKNVVDFTVEGQKSKYEFTQEINGRVIVFTTLENKKEKTVSFYGFELDKKNLTLVNPKKIVQLSFAAVKRDYERASFRSQLSRDKSKLLISYGLTDDEGSMLTFGYVILNNTLKETFKWSGMLDMSDGVYLFDQFRVSNKGEVFLLTRYFKNEKAQEKNTSMKKSNFFSSTRSMEYKKDYEHRVVKFENANTKIIPIPNNDRFYDVLDIETTADGNLILIGFYSPLQDEVMPVGAACLKVNPKTGAITASTKEFGNSFEMPSDISIKNNGLAAGKDQYLKYRFIVSDIRVNKNGGYTLIGERNVMQTKRNGQVFYVVNHLDDLAVVDVSATGTVKNVFKVEKSQQVESLEIFNGSYFYTEHNNNRYIAFANLGKGRAHESVLVTIDPSGKISRKVMFSTEDAEVTLKPKDCELYKGKLMMYGNKNNRFVRWLSLGL